ncbi:MAG: hypothetical protein U5K51_10730 [Flavobacteriaceae bacterium]|nr:hypothetical protein [Flavobacteriaceae bacterium]
MNTYAARGQYCEVVVNDDYKGLYVFMEKLKINGDRINILKMTKTDNADAALTGGYYYKKHIKPQGAIQLPGPCLLYRRRTWILYTKAPNLKTSQAIRIPIFIISLILSEQMMTAQNEIHHQRVSFCYRCAELLWIL